jgi:hypothetical protein
LKSLGKKFGGGGSPAIFGLGYPYFLTGKTGKYGQNNAETGKPIVETWD